MCCFILPISPGQRVATHPSATIAPVGVRRTTGARLRLRGTTRTRQAGRKRSLGAKPTSASAAAPGAVGAHPHALPPETEAPARPSPPTPDRTIPGESSFTLTFRPHSLCLTLTSRALAFSLQRERQPEPLRHRQPGPPPLTQLLAHSQKKKRLAQLHGGSQDHQVTC